MLITSEYRALNSKVHREDPAYGCSSAHDRVVSTVRNLIKLHGQEILDYGCGKRKLEEALGFPITNYDPCIPGLDQVPEPHDIVVCTDVLEHIEPDCLDSVLKDLRRCTKKAAFLLVTTTKARRILPDGRNAHLIQKPYAWWKPEIEKAGFRIEAFKDLSHVTPEGKELGSEFLAICE